MKKYKIQSISGKGENLTKVLVIYTGGTIGMIYDKVTESLVPFNFNSIAENIPELNRLNIELSIVSLEKPIDSSNVSPALWIELVEIIENYYDDYHGFVVLHGTDTMAFSASALSFMIQDLGKPIIFTGAQLPIGLPRTDARENLISSLEIAAASFDEKVIVPEVCIYFNGRLFRGNRSKKQESSQFDAFESENYPSLANIGVLIEYEKKLILPIPKATSPKFYTKLNTDIGILKLFPGISKEFIAHYFDQKNLKAVLIETYGSGNAPSDNWFIDAIEFAIKKGVIIVNVSQCTGGHVMMGKYETSQRLAQIGVISGHDMSTEAALTKLMWVLSQNLSHNEIKEIMEKDIAGELSLIA